MRRQKPGGVFIVVGIALQIVSVAISVFVDSKRIFPSIVMKIRLPVAKLVSESAASLQRIELPRLLKNSKITTFLEENPKTIFGLCPKNKSPFYRIWALTQVERK